LSLHVQEVVFLIHNIFVNLGDIGHDKIEQNNSQNKLVKEPHDVEDINDQWGRKDFFAVLFPVISSWIFNVTQDTVLKGNNPISNRLMNSFGFLCSIWIAFHHEELKSKKASPGYEDYHKRYNLNHDISNQLGLKSKTIINLNDVKVLQKNACEDYDAQNSANIFNVILAYVNSLLISINGY